MKNLSLITKMIGTPLSLYLHTIFFVFMLTLVFFGISPMLVMLILTTIVSLEAIYLNILTLIGVNEQAKHIEDVKLTVNTLQETIDDVQETVDDVQETVDEVQETVDEENK